VALVTRPVPAGVRANAPATDSSGLALVQDPLNPVRCGNPTRVDHGVELRSAGKPAVRLTSTVPTAGEAIEPPVPIFTMARFGMVWPAKLGWTRWAG
jgi:hypothetical protein